MGRKLNPEYRRRTEERLARQVRCAWCGKANHPRYMIQMDEGVWMHGLCITTMEQVKEDEGREAREQRERERKLNLSVRNFWAGEEEGA